MRHAQQPTAVGSSSPSPCIITIIIITHHGNAGGSRSPLESHGDGERLGEIDDGRAAEDLGHRPRDAHALLQTARRVLPVAQGAVRAACARTGSSMRSSVGKGKGRGAGAGSGERGEARGERGEVRGERGAGRWERGEWRGKAGGQWRIGGAVSAWRDRNTASEEPSAGVTSA